MNYKKKEKVLVCIICQTRGYKITWKNFNKYVIKNLGADLAVCVAEKKTNNQFYENAKFIWSFKDRKDYTKLFNYSQKKILKKKKINKNFHNWKKILKIKDSWLSGLGDYPMKYGSGAISIYFRWFLLQKILKEKLHLKYDRFIITRSDFIWTSYHPKLGNLNSDYIWFPNEEKYKGYTDRHAVLSKKNFYDYLNLLEPILLHTNKLFNLMKNKNNWNLESYLKFYLHLMGYKDRIKFFPYVMYLAREANYKTRFFPGAGDYSFKHKYFIKYHKEYIYSLVMYWLLDNKKDYKFFLLYHLIYKIFYKVLFRFPFFIKKFFNQNKINRKFDLDFILKKM